MNESYLKIEGNSTLASGDVLTIEKEDLAEDISALNLAATSLVQEIRLKFMLLKED